MGVPHNTFSLKNAFQSQGGADPLAPTVIGGGGGGGCSEKQPFASLYARVASASVKDTVETVEAPVLHTSRHPGLFLQFVLVFTGSGGPRLQLGRSMLGYKTDTSLGLQTQNVLSQEQKGFQDPGIPLCNFLGPVARLAPWVSLSYLVRVDSYHSLRSSKGSFSSAVLSSHILSFIPLSF